MYDKVNYPNFLAGGPGYVMAMDTAAKLYKASMEVPYLHLEDVFLTGICAEKAQIEPKNYHLFNFGPYKDTCEFRGAITKHQVEPDIQMQAYNFIMDVKNNCAVPNEMEMIDKWLGWVT